jgi:hypothetical protein
MATGDTPTQVRIRTDPEDDHASRYRDIQWAKGVFDVGNNTEAVVRACRHARLDKKAKDDALALLAKHVEPEVLAGVLGRLTTSTLSISVETTIDPSNRSRIRILVDGEWAGIEGHHVSVTSSPSRRRRARRSRLPTVPGRRSVWWAYSRTPRSPVTHAS